jgi:hypothetical protein
MEYKKYAFGVYIKVSYSEKKRDIVLL